MDWIKGMDLSSLLEVERCGGKFYDHGVNGEAMDILKSYGMNMVRLRLWNDPYDGEGRPYGAGGCDIGTVLALAKRAKSKQIGWYLDFHYSDCWTDPGKQTLPKAWRGMDEAALEHAVYDFTLETLNLCKQEDVPPSIVSVGNEVTKGLLWPFGQYPNYKNIARLISAGIRAVRDAAPGAKAMIHLDHGGSNDIYRDWFEHYLENRGEDFDCIGLSYYPFWHGTLDMLSHNMDDLARRYKKDLIIAEVSMGHTMEDYQSYEKLPDGMRKGMATTPKLAEQVPFAMTPEGQAEFMRELLQIIRGVPNHLGKGFFYWEPAWLPVSGSGWASEEAIAYMHERGPGGNEWANQALFDYDGNALPALGVIKEF